MAATPPRIILPSCGVNEEEGHHEVKPASTRTTKHPQRITLGGEEKDEAEENEEVEYFIVLLLGIVVVDYCCSLPGTIR